MASGPFFVCEVFMATPAVVAIAPSIPDAIPAPAPEPIAPPPAAPAVAPAPAPVAAPAAPAPEAPTMYPGRSAGHSDDAAVKALSDALKAVEALETSVSPGTPPAVPPGPGTISIDPATLPPALRAKLEAVGGDVVALLSQLEGEPPAPVIEEPETEPEVPAVAVVEPPPPLTEPVLAQIVAQQLNSDPTYVRVDQAFRADDAQIKAWTGEHQKLQGEIARFEAGLSFEQINGDPVHKAEIESKVADLERKSDRLERRISEKQAVQEKRLTYHRNLDAQIRERVFADHSRKTEAAKASATHAQLQKQYENQFVAAWPAALKAAAIAHQVPVEILNEAAQMHADARLNHGLGIEDIPGFLMKVGELEAKKADVLHRIKSGQYGAAAAARAAAVAPAPAPAPTSPSFVPAPGPTGHEPLPDGRAKSISATIRDAEALLRQNARGATVG